MTRPAMVAVAVLAIAAGLIGLIPDDPAAGALFSVIWAFALGFIWPRLVWFWPLIIGAWLPVGLLTRTLRDQPNGWPGCPNGVAYNWQIALAVFCAIVIFCGAGALVGFAIERLAALPAFRELRWVRFVKPVLAWGGTAVAVAIVFYSALALAQPLHPFAPGERYCWDEYCFRVDSVTRTRTLGPQSHPLVARGTFYVVNATLEAPWWGRLVWGPQSSFVVTRDGGEYSVSRSDQLAKPSILPRPWLRRMMTVGPIRGGPTMALRESRSRHRTCRARQADVIAGRAFSYASLSRRENSIHPNSSARRAQMDEAAARARARYRTRSQPRRRFRPTQAPALQNAPSAARETPAALPASQSRTRQAPQHRK